MRPIHIVLSVFSFVLFVGIAFVSGLRSQPTYAELHNANARVRALETARAEAVDAHQIDHTLRIDAEHALADSVKMLAQLRDELCQADQVWAHTAREASELSKELAAARDSLSREQAAHKALQQKVSQAVEFLGGVAGPVLPGATLPYGTTRNQDSQIIDFYYHNLEVEGLPATGAIEYRDTNLIFRYTPAGTVMGGR